MYKRKLTLEEETLLPSIFVKKGGTKNQSIRNMALGFPKMLNFFLQSSTPRYGFFPCECCHSSLLLLRAYGYNGCGLTCIKLRQGAVDRCTKPLKVMNHRLQQLLQSRWNKVSLINNTESGIIFPLLKNTILYNTKARTFLTDSKLGWYEKRFRIMPPFYWRELCIKLQR